MTPGLRKYHRAFWFSAALILPALFVAAVYALPEPVLAKTEMTSGEPELPKMLRQVETDGFVVQLRADHTQAEYQVVVDPVRMLNIPEALVYLKQGPDTSPEQGILLGKLSGNQVHHFPAPTEIEIENLLIQIYNPFSNAFIAQIKL